MTDRWVEGHQNPSGPGDSRPTAKQIIEAEGLQGRWSGRTVLITGCSSGLGVEVAHALALTGATLYLTARDTEKAKKALGQLVDSDRVHLLKLDLSSLSDVRRVADEFLAKEKSLNILIANAGTMHTPEGRTEDGFETQFGTNHLAHFLLINLLVPALREGSTAAHKSRIVILSSLGHRFGSVNFKNINLDGAYDPAVAYAQSKTANLWTANAIERKFAKDGIHAWAVQPGLVTTGILQHMDEETLKTFGDSLYLRKITKSAEQGAATETWAAASKALEGKGGQYLEDCQIIGAWKEGDNAYGPGYGAHAYNEVDEEKLWALSGKLVGLTA